MSYTYSDIATGKKDVNGHRIIVEHNGKESIHYILGANKGDAIQKLLRTGWYVNSSRNIIK